MAAVDRLLPPRAVSDWLGYAERTLARWRAAGTGPPWQWVGDHARYPTSGVQRWLDEQKTTKGEQAG